MRALRSLVILAALAALVAPASAPAQVEGTPIPTTPKPNFSSMEFMVGTWNCSTKSARRPSAFETVSTYSLDPSGYWINETSTVKPASWIKEKLTTYDKITYDPFSKRWADVTYGDQGAFGLTFSKGWSGDKMTWHDVSFAPGPDISASTDIVNTKVSATKVTSASSFTETKTGRHVSVSTVCTKT